MTVLLGLAGGEALPPLHALAADAALAELLVFGAAGAVLRAQGVSRSDDGREPRRRPRVRAAVRGALDAGDLHLRALHSQHMAAGAGGVGARWGAAGRDCWLY